MIESSLAFGAQSQGKTQETGYSAWQNSVAVTGKRHGATMRYDSDGRTAGPTPTFGAMLSRENALASQISANAYAPSNGTHTDSKPDIAYQTTKPEDGYEFGDVIDMINPLQHLPVIGMMYRKFTGDTIKPFASIIGGTIFGGVVGAVSSTVNAIVKDRTGKDVAENVLSLANINVEPEAEKTDLVYLETKTEDEMAGKTLAATNLYLARDGRQNFAATKPSTYSWNT